ncbi:hypothetical protein Lal_00031033 [Lupinus albus]|uniref:Uncharacterized protein n=1 Tax=Lupinus albus TaxID=3870 RepID=A0A6A5LNA5_LUPAL|nr:hypothetical protein Lalb_Chr17g0342001 [Lupinus albus]KAF1863904.1 hypothetical protein Lal_00031033 [Lupinus albus]
MDTQYDDDSFYAEIRKQILLLTSEDNEEILERKSTGVFIPQARSRNHRSWKNESCSRLPPHWFVKLWKNENEKWKGTGVFIPQAVTFRRKISHTRNIEYQESDIWCSGGELKNMYF